MKLNCNDGCDRVVTLLVSGVDILHSIPKCPWEFKGYFKAEWQRQNVADKGIQVEEVYYFLVSQMIKCRRTLVLSRVDALLPLSSHILCSEAHRK